MLRKTGLTAAVCVTLALGIGTATTVFSFVDGVLLDSLPYTNPAQMVAVLSEFVPVTQCDIPRSAPFDVLDSNRAL